MSEPIPEAVPTSADPRSKRPIKRARTNATPNTVQATEIENLMWDPTIPVVLPPSSSETKKSLAAPPEIVANVQGSSAGAGSGEFHVYKASRRREYERLRAMDEEAEQESEDAKWESVERRKKEQDEEKTRKNREKRNKRKNKKDKKGGEDRKVADVTNGSKEGKSIKPLDVKRRGSGSEHGDTLESGRTDFAVAEIVKENGIVIHDDD